MDQFFIKTFLLEVFLDYLDFNLDITLEHIFRPRKTKPALKYQDEIEYVYSDTDNEDHVPKKKTTKRKKKTVEAESEDDFDLFADQFGTSTASTLRSLLSAPTNARATSPAENTDTDSVTDNQNSTSSLPVVKNLKPAPKAPTRHSEKKMQ